MGRVAEALPGFEKRLMVDCQGYRRGLESQLVEDALAAAEQVRKTRQALELAPMNPYERRLVHIALQDEKGVSAASSGDGFIKTIVISPA
jgi:spoIIIJ-associated protein